MNLKLNREVLDKVCDRAGCTKSEAKEVLKSYNRILYAEILDVDIYDPNSYKVLSFPYLCTFVPIVKNYLRTARKYCRYVDINRIKDILAEYVPTIKDFTFKEINRLNERDTQLNKHAKKINENKL